MQKYAGQHSAIDSQVNQLKAKGGKEPQGLEKQINTDEDRD
jgi:hypothetical protein